MKYKVIEVNAAVLPDDKNKYLNKRVEMWDRCKEWLSIGAIPDGKTLYKDLTTPRYSYSLKTSQLQLERKDEMKRRGEHSPDEAEALIQTFFKPIARTDTKHSVRKRPFIVNGLATSFFG
jgi:hypothetical protein